MEQSSFQGKLIRSARDAAVIKVHSKEDPPDFRMRSTKVFAWVKRTAQTKAIFQVIIADGCLFYGNYALRSRGGCCICLLMASGLIAKRFSMWVADAEEGEFYYTISSKRFKLAVFIILPRVVYTSHQCVSQSEMDDNRSGGHENITKDFLTYMVRHLSRLYVDKTKGQEVIWKHRPSNWPENLTWKNPTSPPKDSTETLREKYYHLKSLVPNEKLSQIEQNAFQDYEAGNTVRLKSFMCFTKLNDHIIDMMNMLHRLQQPHLQLFDEQLKLLTDKVTSLFSSLVASSSGRETAADTLSSTLSKKRKPINPISVQSKKSKPEMPNSGNNIQNNSRKRKDILPKLTQTTSNGFPTMFPQGTVLAQSSALESPVRNTCPYQSQQSLGSSNNTMPNTYIDIPILTTLADHPETAAATNSLPSVVVNAVWGIMNPSATEPLASSTTVTPTLCNPSLGSHEQLSKTVSDSVPITSLDSGTWSQESSVSKEAWLIQLYKQQLSKTVSDSIPITSLDSGTWSQESSVSKESCPMQLYEQNLNDKDIQDGLQFIENISNTTDQNNDFDPSIFMNFSYITKNLCTFGI